MSDFYAGFTVGLVVGPVVCAICGFILMWVWAWGAETQAKIDAEQVEDTAAFLAKHPLPEKKAYELVQTVSREGAL